MKKLDGNPYKKGTKAYKAYDKGFNDGYSYYIDLELERLKDELDRIKMSHRIYDMVNRIINRYKN